MSITHLLDRELTHYRTTGVRTPSGGLSEARTAVGVVWVRVPQPSSSTGPAATERVLARTQVGPQQGGAEMVHPIWVEPDEDIRRGDELADDSTGEVWRVVADVYPSVDGVYLRLDCEKHQADTVGAI